MPSDKAACRVVSAACRLPVSYSTPDEQRHPPGENQELVGRHERVLGTEPVSHNPQAFKRRLAQVRHLRAPFPDAEDLGRGAIDAVFAVALTEQERNQDAR
jgi:hypothetical protein